MQGNKLVQKGEALWGEETRIAVASAALLYVTGAILIATTFLLPDVGSPAGAAGVAAAALLTAVLLMVLISQGRASLDLALAAELWGIAIICVLCASTGATKSPFAMLYFFAIGHAAAFQPRRRVVFTAAIGLLAFLAPLIYSSPSEDFAAIACVGVVLALLTTTVVHVALEWMRADRGRLEMLIAATAKLDTSLDPQQTLRRITATALPELAELCVIDLLDTDGAITDTVAASVDPRLAARVEQLRAEQPPGRFENHPIARVLSSRSSCVVQDLEDTPVLAEALRSSGVRAAANAIDKLTVMVVPMVARGRLLGVISFVHDGPQRRGQLEVVEDLAGRAALAYDNARLYAERTHVAHTLRSSLMPAELPTIRGLELESYFRPMGAGNEVGGDFYDVFEDKDSCWLVVGDVCGKGAEAAVLTAFLRHTTVAYAREGGGPATVLTRVNEAMLEQDFDRRFATVILARLTFAGAGVALTLAAAGHPAALLSRAHGAPQELGERGTLLGVFEQVKISETTTILRAGDSLTLYTDGLTEAHAPTYMLSPADMLGALSHNRPDSAGAAIGSLLELIDLTQGARDDIAILTARIEGVEARRAQAA